jgi:hypothetical protein
VNEISRRTLLGGAVVAAASAAWSESLEAKSEDKSATWQAADFDKLTHVQKRMKQVIHGNPIDGARFLNNAKNSLVALRFDMGVPADQIQIVCALNGPANTLNFTDYIWQKYNVGQWAKVTDPKTGQPATRNIFYPSKAGNPPHYSSDDPHNEDSAFQDNSIQGLMANGIRFIGCHNSTEQAARGFIAQNGLSAPVDEVVKDMLAHTLPGVLITPALAGALAMLQSDGHYSYMAA